VAAGVDSDGVAAAALLFVVGAEVPVVDLAVVVEAVAAFLTDATPMKAPTAAVPITAAPNRMRRCVRSPRSRRFAVRGSVGMMVLLIWSYLDELRMGPVPPTTVSVPCEPAGKSRLPPVRLTHRAYGVDVVVRIA
jgi:hypothetical protein